MPPSGRSLTYRDTDTTMTGMIFRDDARPGASPGLLLLHGGAGLDDHAREQAARWAALGYVVLACDLYGEGVAGDRERIMSQLAALRDDPSLLVRRARAALDVLHHSPGVVGRLAAVGYCFGGLAALTLARAGEELAGVVSIHGSLATVSPARPGGVRARILVCHGASDPHVPPGDVSAFAEEMENARADWRLVMYGGAVHGFTHRHAVPGAAVGVAYDARADRRSFEDAGRLLAEVFDEAHPAPPPG